jgi:hypothetical protein
MEMVQILRLDLLQRLEVAGAAHLLRVGQAGLAHLVGQEGELGLTMEMLLLEVAPVLQVKVIEAATVLLEAAMHQPAVAVEQAVLELADTLMVQIYQAAQLGQAGVQAVLDYCHLLAGHPHTTVAVVAVGATSMA